MEGEQTCLLEEVAPQVAAHLLLPAANDATFLLFYTHVCALNRCMHLGLQFLSYVKALRFSAAKVINFLRWHKSICFLAFFLASAAMKTVSLRLFKREDCVDSRSSRA